MRRGKGWIQWEVDLTVFPIKQVAHGFLALFGQFAAGGALGFFGGIVGGGVVFAARRAPIGKARLIWFQLEFF
jgi:hypothetical protein